MGFFDRFRKAKPEPDFRNEADVMHFLLNGGIANALTFQTELHNDRIYIPALQMTIRPIVSKLAGNYVNLGFDMYGEKWDKCMYESSTGTGRDTRSAVGQAVASFAFAFMAGLKRMTDQYQPRMVESEFAGHKHNWNVYLSDVVAIGAKKDAQEPGKVGLYWELLRENIIERLGNQKLVYVKIFAAKLPGQVTGECRIDDVPIPELGDKVAKIAEQWEVSGWASEKQFFFIEQSPETLLPNPYSGKAGRERLKSLVIEYLKLFRAVDSQEAYDSLLESSAQRLGDRVLAIECFSFLPEILAERFWARDMVISDDMMIIKADGTAIPAYRSQLSDYDALDKITFEILSEAVFGEDTKDILMQLACCSAFREMMDQMKEKQGNLSNVSVKMVYNVEDGFVLR